MLVNEFNEAPPMDEARYERIAKVLTAAQPAGLLRSGFLTDPADARGFEC
jgi:hypothetical protein